MKKILFVVLLLCLIVAPTTVHSAEVSNKKIYLTVGGGGGGEAKTGNISFNAGFATAGEGTNYLFGAGAFITLEEDETPSDTLEYPVPHSNYTSLGRRQKGSGYGFFGKVGLEVIRNKGFFVFGLGGVALAEYIELAQSNITGWYYEQSSSTESHGLHGVGLGYFPKDK